jgi:PBP1b-binding outer membrane lipoprotein LpoB
MQSESYRVVQKAHNEQALSSSSQSLALVKKGMERGATRGPHAAILDWYGAMNSKLNPGQTDPRDVARATEQIVRALNPKQTDQPDVQRATENLSKAKARCRAPYFGSAAPRWPGRPAF